ncbi:hypothetical protein [Micromonospora sp. NPDC002717]|uniref:hypothetical protein n=1 Tax=Micromonospora sp. NPDC002717 TaxID=3154424 RepID=UPI0033325454
MALDTGRPGRGGAAGVEEGAVAAVSGPEQAARASSSSGPRLARKGRIWSGYRPTPPWPEYDKQPCWSNFTPAEDRNRHPAKIRAVGERALLVGRPPGCALVAFDCSGVSDREQPVDLGQHLRVGHDMLPKP